jgi:hypothetical protein
MALSRATGTPRWLTSNHRRNMTPSPIDPWLEQWRYLIQPHQRLDSPALGIDAVSRPAHGQSQGGRVGTEAAELVCRPHVQGMVSRASRSNERWVMDGAPYSLLSRWLGAFIRCDRLA